jgi:hypothetical protein
MDNKEKALKELRTIPGVGKVVAIDLWNLVYKSIHEYMVIFHVMIQNNKRLSKRVCINQSNCCY